MDDTEAELTLTAPADPMRWEWQPGHTSGFWRGKSEGGNYFIFAPISPDDVDATIYSGSWHVEVRIKSKGSVNKLYVSTAERGKELCLLALTGGMKPLRALRATLMAEGKIFIKAKLRALSQLEEAAKSDSPPELDWPADAPGVPVFQAIGTCGIYTVCFEPERRWVVTLIENGMARDERCFLTRVIARLACNVHSHTGNWFGTL